MYQILNFDQRIVAEFGRIVISLVYDLHTSCLGLKVAFELKYEW